MSRPLDSPVVRFLGFVVAVVIPILGYLAKSWRPMEVGAAFLLHELSGVRSIVLLLMMLMPLAGWGAFLLLRRRNRSSLLAINILHTLGRARLLLLVGAAVSLLATGIHLRMRYRLFSETSYQERVLAAVDAGEIPRARTLCLRYLQLFPQRRADGGFPDPVCAPVLRFSSSMAALHAYVEGQSPTGLNIDQMSIAVEPLAKEQALEILGEWGGR